MFHIAKTFILLLGILASEATLPFASAKAAESTAFLTEVAKDWDRAAFSVKDEAKQSSALQDIKSQLSAALKTEPNNAAFRAWRGIVLATEANSMDGLAALKKADEARKELESAIALNPDPSGDGFAVAILGALYDAAPGFPIGFGDKKKALRHLKRALELNPSSIDAGYFLSSYYAEKRDFDAARKYIALAKAAPPRPGREIGDAGRLQDIQDLQSEIAAKRP